MGIINHWSDQIVQYSSISCALHYVFLASNTSYMVSSVVHKLIGLSLCFLTSAVSLLLVVVIIICTVQQVYNLVATDRQCFVWLGDSCNLMDLWFKWVNKLCACALENMHYKVVVLLTLVALLTFVNESQSYISIAGTACETEGLTALLLHKILPVYISTRKLAYIDFPLSWAQI